MKAKPLLTMTAVLVSITGISSAQTASLKQTFKDHFIIGAALNESQFTGTNPAQTAIISRHYNTTTPENVMKWGHIHPLPNAYDFKAADQYVEFGEKHGMFIIGHTLVWHMQTPDWVFINNAGGVVDRETLLTRLEDHIRNVVGRYKGQIKGWDVVNEALNDDGTLRNSPWLEIIGPDYLEKAFQFAHAADPDAELYYNDYSLESPRKRAGAVALVKTLLSAKVRIHGIGSQMHVGLEHPSAAEVDETLTEFGKLGIKVMVTELDVDVLPPATQTQYQGADISLRIAADEALNPYTQGCPEHIQQQTADRYVSLFKVFTKHHKILDRVTFWGVTDGDSWLNHWPVHGRTNFPLLFDRRNAEKPALYQLLETAAPQVKF